MQLYGPNFPNIGERLYTIPGRVGTGSRGPLIKACPAPMGKLFNMYCTAYATIADPFSGVGSLL